MTEDRVPTRREELRHKTVSDIKQEGLRLLGEGPVDDVTLAAIARTLRMSVPGLYRYFASRDDLLVALAADSYEELAETMEEACTGPGEVKLAAVTSAYRAWAIGHPGQYRLLFSTTWGSGGTSRDKTVPSAHRAMRAILAAVQATEGSSARDDTAQLPRGQGTALDRQLRSWSRELDASKATHAHLRRAIHTWTSLHGLVSLEIEGVWTAMGIDADLLFATDV